MIKHKEVLRIKQGNNCEVALSTKYSGSNSSVEPKATLAST